MKQNILILGGGNSSEHEVSLVSAYNILTNINTKKYQPFLVAIDKKGVWRTGDDLILNPENLAKVYINPTAKKIVIDSFLETKKIAVVFPILHGTKGEDGCIQGFFETLGLAFVGSSVKSSALCMDKTLTKIILEQNGIKTAAYRVFFSNKITTTFKQLTTELNSKTLVVKASSLGSSVGVYLCSNQAEFSEAIKKIKPLDSKILVEEEIKGREIEIAILGNDNPKASLAGEILLEGYSFYSYKAKYLSKQGIKLRVPTELDCLAKVQQIAIESYKTLQCSGMARIDFFVTDKQIILNEINTLPGFTSISMYPKLWQVSGIGYEKLIEQLINLALEKNRS